MRRLSTEHSRLIEQGQKLINDNRQMDINGIDVLQIYFKNEINSKEWSYGLISKKLDIFHFAHDSFLIGIAAGYRMANKRKKTHDRMNEQKKS